jgi:hypothetical protein
VLQQTAESQIPATALHTGDRFDLGDNGRLEVLMTDEDGAVLILEWQDFSALLPIGVSPDQLADLVENQTPVDLLLLTGDSAMSTWINIATPQIVWTSTEGELPTSTQVVAQGTRVIEASQYSWLRLITDGTDIWLEADH